MVFINEKKFACESCIKGHRSSSCHHTERPLFEIKKKGRPVSQCERCRQLRQSKRVHSKCTCNEGDPVSQASSSSLSSSLSSAGPKPRRFVPIIPALPNGLKDIVSSNSSSGLSPDSRQRVDSLLNPCHCKSVWKCQCQSRGNSSAADASAPTAGPRQEGEAGLVTLARAAAMCCDSEPRSPTSSLNMTTPLGPKHIASRPHSPSHKRQKSVPPPLPVLLQTHELPPILSSAPLHSMPDFPIIPGVSTLDSIAGSGCTCGFQCTCPGCVEHRGSEHASKSHKDCRLGCGHCVDHAAGPGLPMPASSSTGSPSAMDRFFARAAALPLPPHHRRPGIQLDPMNVTMYERGGLVRLPKLECCGGRCGCPSDSCACGQACDGRCAEHAGHRPQGFGSMHAGAAGATLRSPSSAAEAPALMAISQACCSSGPKS